MFQVYFILATVYLWDNDLHLFYLVYCLLCQLDIVLLRNQYACTKIPNFVSLRMEKRIDLWKLTSDEVYPMFDEISSN